jgi:CRISPR-associated protein Cmx8
LEINHSQAYIPTNDLGEPERKIIKVHQHKVVGFGVLVTGLNALDSISLQINGCGGKPKMGCGFFSPVSSSFEPANSNNLVWTKLWQEVTWAILRPRDKQRLPFKAMVNGEAPSEFEKIWNLLQNQPSSQVSLSGTYMLGVQAKNNEGVPFTDVAKNQFLLNFWSYVAQIYLPLKINAKGEPKLHGYAIAIPDVRHLAAFCQHFPAILQQRKIEELWGKPRSALIRNIEETGLDSFGSIHTYLSQIKSELNIDKLLFGIDVFHIFRFCMKKDYLVIAREFKLLAHHK